MTEQEEREYEAWKRSRTRNGRQEEALFREVYQYTHDPWYHNSKFEDAYVEEGAPESSIREYFLHCKEVEEERKRRIEGMERLERARQEARQKVTSTSNPQPISEKRENGCIIREWKISDYLRSQIPFS